jgi:hypothetical protein
MDYNLAFRLKTVQVTKKYKSNEIRIFNTNN